MAPRKSKESLLDLCTRATVLGNTISVRMLEYLSTAKHQPHGFRDLAVDFLDCCRILWSIEAGLAEASRKKNEFPPEMVSELDKKFRQTNDDFIVLNQTILKFLDYERKGGLGRLQRGWRMMFADTDIEKLRESLSKSRDALRMSSVLFRWSLGDAKVDASVGIGYTGLVAALERMNAGKTTTLIPQLDSTPERTQSQPQPQPQPQSAPQHQQLPQSFVQEAPELPPQLPPVSLEERISASNLVPRPDDGLSQTTRESVAFPRRNTPLTEMMTEDNFSDGSTDSKTLTLIEDQLQDMDLSGKISLNQVVHLKADPTTVPRWTPRQTTGHNSASLKNALVEAVQQKKYKTLEQLLDSGVKLDSASEAQILRRAGINRDLEALRLLLLFGADPNGIDKDGLTPLYSATKVPFIEGAKLLIRYGADPNRSAGPDEESPLALAVDEHRLEFIHLYLSYGGDPSLILENGETALIKAITKSMPVKIVELMLNYGTDPNAKNAEGKTALFEAIQTNRVDLMTLLLDHGADPNLPGPKHLLWPSTYKPKCLKLLLSRGADYKKTPGIMELASSIKNIESISILLDAGVSPNIKKDGVYTPLCSAIRDNSKEIVTLLLSNGADPNLMASEYPAFKCVTHHRTHLLPQLIAAGSDPNTPKGIIEKAVAHNNRDALTYLLEQGVNPNDRTPEGNTALTTAIRDDRGEIVDLLLANGADPGVRGQDWPICMAVRRPAILKKLLPHISNPRAIRGVMEMAVVANQLESIKLLLSAGVSVEDKNGGVFSPLTTAIREQRKDIVRFLLDEAGADPNAPGEHLPIIKAIRRCPVNDTEIIEMLLARGTDINQMYRGWNAVLQAVENGDGNILRILVTKGNGVDLQATDENGRPVIDIVTERGWDEAISLLFPVAEAR